VPISYAIDRVAQLIRTRCYGDVTLSEVLNHFQALKTDSERSNHLDVLLDLHEVTSSPTADQIRAASEGPDKLKGLLSFGYCAIVASRDVIFGMARMWAVFVEHLFTEVAVFRSSTEAEVWLAQQRTEKRISQGN
jgi:hypothetical protein